MIRMLELGNLDATIKRFVCSDTLFEVLAPWGCGVFDGGCFAFAQAVRRHLLGEGQLQMLLLSELIGVHRSEAAVGTNWGHVVLRVKIAQEPGAPRLRPHEQFRYIDGFGVQTYKELKANWVEFENCTIHDAQTMAVSVIKSHYIRTDPVIVSELAYYLSHPQEIKGSSIDLFNETNDYAILV